MISNSPTDSYLDVALFNKILERLEDKPDDPYTLESLIRNALCKCDKSKSAATLSLDSLVEMGVLEKKEKNFILGLKYPTVDPGMFRLNYVFCYMYVYKALCKLTTHVYYTSSDFV